MPPALLLLPPSLFFSIFLSLFVVKCGVTGVMGVNGIYGLYGVNGTPVFGVPRASLSTRRSRTVVWIPGDFRGSAKERRGRDCGWGDEGFGLTCCWEGGVERVRPGLPLLDDEVPEFPR